MKARRNREARSGGDEEGRWEGAITSEGVRSSKMREGSAVWERKC